MKRAMGRDLRIVDRRTLKETPIALGPAMLTKKAIKSWYERHTHAIYGFLSFFVGVSLTFAGLAFSTPDTEIWHHLLIYSGLMTAITGPVSFLWRFESRYHRLEQAVHDGVLARTIAEHPMAATPLASALREVVKEYLMAHDYGGFPIMGRAQKKWEITILSVDRYKEFGIPPNLPRGYETLWLLAIVKDEWSIRPIDDRRERPLDPTTYLPPFSVLTYNAYAWDLAGYVGPSTLGGQFFPLGRVVAEDDEFMDALRGVSYLRHASGTGRSGTGAREGREGKGRSDAEGQIPQALQCVIERSTGGTPVASATIWLAPRYHDQNGGSAAKEKDIIERIPALRQLESELANACDSVLQVYEPSSDSVVPESVLIQRGDTTSSWRYKFHYEYVLPVVVAKNGLVIHTLSDFIIPFSHATQLESFSFLTRCPEIKFSESRGMIVNSAINSQIRPKLEDTRAEWSWRPSMDTRCLLPGDTVMVSWEWDSAIVRAAFSGVGDRRGV